MIRALRSTPFSTAVILTLRSLLLVLGVRIVNSMEPLGSSEELLFGSVIAGVAIGSVAAFSRLTNRGLLLLTLVIPLLISWIAGSASELIAGETVFGAYSVSEHLEVGLTLAAIASGLTWWFWRYRHAVTFELAGLLLLMVFLFSGHREFRFDTPRVVNDLSWSFGMEPVLILVFLGVGLTLTFLVYGLSTTAPSRAFGGTERVPVVAHGRIGIPRLLGLIGVIVGLVYLIAWQTYDHYRSLQMTRIANGVGSERSPGMSPLGFHSALGSTNQPAALVRLDTDYRENPFSPMLYFRESALSLFNGREMVLADRTYDRDVTGTNPEEPFHADPDPLLVDIRRPVSLSAYLLADHNSVFAVDYPTLIAPLKNPQPQRFKGAFRAESLAPTYSLEAIAGDEVGDPSWSEEMRRHYLATHSDSRYRDMALELSKDAATLPQKAFAITSYLSKNSIYTLQPNHDIKPGEDPVAPFLFGDKRGYCVHFAHATVYMFRALGIPARIGTGYLTDLSQSKDGHILLRMSDRHAWAEIYIRHKGWIPFDTKPETVESAADTQIDMKLLEELMGMIGPDEDILPKDVAAGENSVELEPTRTPLLDSRDVLAGVLFLVAALFLVKLYVRTSWFLTRDPSRRVRRLYRAMASFYFDLGMLRDIGETRAEFQERVSDAVGFTALQNTRLMLLRAYAPYPLSDRELLEGEASFQQEQELTKQIPIHWRLVAALNPSSALAFLTGSRW